MSQFWTLFKRWGMPLAMRIGLAMPLLLGVGALLILVAIWWLGPQWSWREQQPLASVAHRSVASLLLVLVPLLCWAVVLRNRFRSLQAERRQDAAAQADPCLPLIHAQERALDRQLANYLGNAGGRRALYRSPWYLMLGDNCAGKSGFIEGTSQRFSLTRIGDVQARGQQVEQTAFPVGWWVSNEAVILDPPGDLIIHDASDAPQQNAHQGGPARLPAGIRARLWSDLLAWLLRNRSRRALNGLLLVVDLPALLHGAPEQRTALAYALRTRLHEVSSQLGARLPLYVVLSKFDLLDGFEAFFKRLSPAQREQLLGFTFRLDALSRFDAWQDEFVEQYDRLILQLQAQTLQQLLLANGLPQRTALVSLLAQLGGLRPILTGFLHEVLASDRFTTPPLVRGVFWCSVRQQGEVSNAFVREAAQPYNTPLPPRESTRQLKAQRFFAQQVLQQVVYKEAGLAGDNVQVARSKRQLLWVGSAVGVLALAVATATWHRYFDLNGAKAAGVLDKSRSFSQQTVDPRLDPSGRNLLEPLDQIRDAVAVFGDYRAAWPLLADAGLYQGRVIGPRVDEAYLSLLSRRFLPALASGVVDAMDAAPVGSEQQMAALRVYRMLEDRHNRRPQWVEAWMASQWQQAYPGQGQVQRDLMRHLQYALAYADVDLPQFKARIESVQQALRKVPLPQRVYATLKQQALERLPYGLDLRQQVGPVFDIIYQPGERATEDIHLAPLLTAKGFTEYFEPQSRHITDMALIDQWALGERKALDYSDADRKALTERVRALYSADYIASWQRALQALAIADFRDLDHAVKVLEQLTGPAAPLQRLLETVRDNTVIQPVPASPSVVDTVSASPLPLQVTGISRAFSGLNAMLEEKGEKPSYYDETLGAIIAVHEYARTVQSSPDRGNAALQAVLQRFSMQGADPIGMLQRVATGLPEPVRQQVRAVAEQTSRVLNVEALRELERRWDREVYSFFQQRLAGRYPFEVKAPDASLEDFEAFFGPKGRLQQFQDQYLKVVLKDNFEALRADRHGTSLIREDVIEQLQAAERIRETFFDPRGNLSVQFSIEPLGLSASQRTSLLDLDGQLISYAHGPRQIIGVIWPNTLGQQVRSNLTLLGQGGNSSSLEYRGPWSMFRLLSRGALNGRTESSVDLSLRAGDGVMRYRLNAEKAFNPITQQPFKGFRLPRGLLQGAQ